jgi:hypothetical protein
MVSMMNGRAVVTPLTQNEKMRVLRNQDGAAVVLPDNAPIIDRLERMLDVLGQYLPPLQDRQLVLDTGALVGQLTPQIDRRMGLNSDLSKRGR